MADKEYTLDEIMAMGPVEGPPKPVLAVAAPVPGEHDYNAPQAFVKGLEHGATLGFGDRIAAGVDYLTSKIPGVRKVAQGFNESLGGSAGSLPVDNPDLTYAQRLEAIRGGNKAAAAQHPVADVAGNVGGALLPSLPMGAIGVGSKAAQAALPGASTAIRVLTPIAEGSSYGALSAVGDEQEAAHGAKIGALMGLPGAVLTAAAKPLGRLATRLGTLNRNPVVTAAAKAEELGTQGTQAAKQEFREFITKNPATADLVNGAPGPKQIENIRLAVNDSKEGLVKTWPGLKGDLEKVQAAIESGKIEDVRKVQQETLAVMARTKNGQTLIPKFNEFVNLTKAQKALDVATSGSHGVGNSMAFSRPLEMAAMGNPRAMFIAAKEAATGNRPLGHMSAIAMGLGSKVPRMLDMDAAKLAHAVASKDQDAIYKVAGELVKKGITRAAINQTLKNWGAGSLDEEKPISLGGNAD